MADKNMCKNTDFLMRFAEQEVICLFFQHWSILDTWKQDASHNITNIYPFMYKNPAYRRLIIFNLLQKRPNICSTKQN